MPDYAQTIDEQYRKQLEAQQTKLGAAYSQNRAGYEKQLADAPEQYQAMRNQAYTDNAMAEQARKENMANMGMSGAGGTSQTLQQRNQTSLLDTLGATSRQQQDYTDNINLALGNLKTQYDADSFALTQQNAADLIGAQNAYSQWQSGYDLSKDQLALNRDQFGLSQEQFGLTKEQFGLTQDQFGLTRDQFGLTQQNSKFDQAWALYQKKLITKKQFEQMTGYNLK